jgi:hypothetical protein
MSDANLLFVCVTALIAVVGLLALLAGMIRILTALFPEPGGDDLDASVVAAIQASAAARFPDRMVTSIEEIR